MRLPIFYLSSLSLFPAISLSKPEKKYSNNDKKILLSTVQTLTLHAGRQTTHRRVPAVPQLRCIGGGGCQHYEVDVLRCENQGSDYDEELGVQWTCRASLPREFKLGSTDVVCEGYDSPDDRYVLKGSCGVEYRLILTDAGEEKFGPLGGGGGIAAEGKGMEGEAGTVFKFLFFVLFAGVLFLILKSIFQSLWTGEGGAPTARRRRPPRQPNASGLWGGGGNDDDNPPPPYDYRPSSSKSTGQNSWPVGSRTTTTRQAGGWRPGFWTGMGTGAAAGYAAASTANRSRNRDNDRPSPSSGRSDNSSGSHGYGNTGQGSSSYSAGRYESSGFGSTSRR